MKVSIIQSGEVGFVLGGKRDGNSVNAESVYFYSDLQQQTEIPQSFMHDSCSDPTKSIWEAGNQGLDLH